MSATRSALAPRNGCASQSIPTKELAAQSAPEYRGERFGREQLDDAIAHCRSAPGGHKVHLQAVSNKRAACGADKRAGCKRWDQMPRAHVINDVALDNDLMLLMLDDGADRQTPQAKGTDS
jgi:RimJ/RimL family protein N-acetyltransferase